MRQSGSSTVCDIHDEGHCGSRRAEGGICRLYYINPGLPGQNSCRGSGSYIPAVLGPACDLDLVGKVCAAGYWIVYMGYYLKLPALAWGHSPDIRPKDILPLANTRGGGRYVAQSCRQEIAGRYSKQGCSSTVCDIHSKGHKGSRRAELRIGHLADGDFGFTCPDCSRGAGSDISAVLRLACGLDLVGQILVPGYRTVDVRYDFKPLGGT